MKIQLDAYRDGGSLSIKLDEEDHFVIDRRIKQNPSNIVWRGYPDKDGSRHATIIEICLVYNFLVDYKNDCDPIGKEYYYDKTVDILYNILESSTFITNMFASDDIIFKPYTPIDLLNENNKIK